MISRTLGQRTKMFSIKVLFILYLLIVIKCQISAKYVEISSKNNGAYFKYREGIDGEKGLHDCEYNEVCNVVHNRFWLPPLVERLCRCLNGLECPWSMNIATTNVSMKVNNRSVLKHCLPMKSLRICDPKETAIVINGNGDINNTYMTPHKVTTTCQCPNTHYWRLQKVIYNDDNKLYQMFRCVKQRVCDSHDFCGYARTDLFSIYYRCTCPVSNLCIFKDKKAIDVQELLYTGPAYIAYCYPIKV